MPDIVPGYDGDARPPEADPRRALNALFQSVPADSDPKQRLLDYAAGQRAKGERAVAASSTLRALRAIKTRLAADTQPIVNELHGVAADEALPEEQRRMTSRAQGEQRERLIAQLVGTVAERVTNYTKLEQALLAEFPKVKPPEWRDVAVPPEKSAKLGAEAESLSRLRPADFLTKCWNAALELDVATCVYFLPIAKSFQDDPRYAALAGASPLGAADPLAEVIAAFEMVRVTWENHAARIAREVLPRLRAQAELVAQTIVAPPYGWTGSFAGRVVPSTTPDLDDPAPPHARPLDDPERYSIAPDLYLYPIIFG